MTSLMGFDKMIEPGHVRVVGPVGPFHVFRNARSAADATLFFVELPLNGGRGHASDGLVDCCVG